MTINGVAGEGGPGDAHCTLTNPSSFSAPGVSAFEAPTGAGACPQLATETTYFVVVEWVNPSGTGSFAVIPQTYSTRESAATGEDPGGAEGWSIADQSHYLTVSSNVRTWTAYDETASFKIEVKEPAAKVNNPATGLPTISGTTKVGETLTAETSGISDADGLTNVEFSYQWLADDADISGATDSTYTLTDAEAGKAIKVRTTFTDDADNEESLTSAAASGPLAGFTLLDASAQTVLASLEDGDEVSLDDPSGGSYAIRADTESGSTIGSVKLELTGAKIFTQTESISPYSLYGDNGPSALHGQDLPVGFYTLRATAYSKRAGGGGVLGILSVSFIVTETAPEPLTAAFQEAPDAHNGTDTFSFRIAFSEPVATSYNTLKDSALTVTGGEVTSASRVGGAQRPVEDHSKTRLRRQRDRHPARHHGLCRHRRGMHRGREEAVKWGSSVHSRSLDHWEQPVDGSAHYQRHGPGGRDAHGDHRRHRRRRRADQRRVQLPVAGRRRGHPGCRQLSLRSD